MGAVRHQRLQLTECQWYTGWCNTRTSFFKLEKQTGSKILTISPRAASSNPFQILRDLLQGLYTTCIISEATTSG